LNIIKQITGNKYCLYLFSYRTVNGPLECTTQCIPQMRPDIFRTAVKGGIKVDVSEMKKLKHN